MRQVFLEKNRSKKSVDENTYLGVDLSSRAKLLPYNSTTDVLSLNSLYLKERDECTKYRLILTVNPVCSNVLFNSRTEVVRYEGSDKCELLVGSNTGDVGQAMNNSAFDWRQALRDTEYTHPDLYSNGEPYVYHCGFDIFNNHLLRKSDFIYINKTKAKNAVFNTLKDFVRDNDGNEVKETVSLVDTANTKNTVHIYQYDTLMSLYDAFSENLKEVDGWYGFYNTTNVAIPNVTVKNKNNNDLDIAVNKVMNNNKSCELIDLYPDRSLYSFIPKVNKYRHRIEKNWDYCLTYPYKKDLMKLNEMMGLQSNLSDNDGGGAIKVIGYKITYTASGTRLVRLKSIFKTTIKPEDNITLFYRVENETTLNKINNKIKIIETGDYEGKDTDRYIAFKFSDIAYKFNVDGDIIKTTDGRNVTFYYKKNVSSYDCQYYFRVFRKITNVNGEDLVSDINKLAYGENIYGDRIAQVIFTDTIDVDGILDHNKRGISDLYFTVIKRNKGHELWYEQGVTNNSEIEFSHCFGDVTSGIEMTPEVDDYNVRKLHNLDLNNSVFKSGGNKKIFGDLKTVKPIQSGITIDSNLWNNGLYGDIVEFNPYDYVENVIAVVEHRFNTAQREYYKDDKFAEIVYDRLLYDDYDIGVTKDKNGSIVDKFTVTTENVATVDNQTFYGNINPEGYFYNPFNKIKIREESGNLNKVIGTNIKFNTESIGKTTVTIKDEDGLNRTLTCVRIRTAINYNIIKGDTIAFYNIGTKETDWLTVYNVNGTLVELFSDKVNIDGLIREMIQKNIYIVKTNEGVPDYAKYLPDSHSFVWRNLLLPSELANDSDIYDIPFANGCLYLEKNTNLFLKRQDPINEYGLLLTNKSNINNPMAQYKVWGWDRIDFDNIKTNMNLFNGICM